MPKGSRLPSYRESSHKERKGSFLIASSKKSITLYQDQIVLISVTFVLFFKEKKKESFGKVRAEAFFPYLSNGRTKITFLTLLFLLFVEQMREGNY